MKTGKHTAAELAKVGEGPPSPRQMRTIVYAMVEDNDLDRARQVAGEMVAYSHQRDVADDEFFYWMGVRQTLLAIAAGAFQRWCARAARRTVPS